MKSLDYGIVSESGTADFKVQGISGNFLPVFVSNLLPGQKAIISLDVANSGEIEITDVKTDGKYKIMPITTFTISDDLRGRGNH